MHTLTTSIAFCGKGGAGKTTVCALAVKYLISYNKKILVIDADPAGGLSWALGISPKKTLNDLQQELASALERKTITNTDELYLSANYELLSSLIENTGYDFLSIGRSEQAGCYCSINAFLRHCIAELAAHYDYICIDGEAGLEQVNRRVLETVTHCIIVSDTSKRSIAIAHNLLLLTKKRMQSPQCSVIINKVGDSYCECSGLPIIGLLPISKTIAEFDSTGRSLLDIGYEDDYYKQLKNVLAHVV